MKKYIGIIISILVLSACSNHKNENNKNEIVGVEIDGVIYALDHAAKAALANNAKIEDLVCKTVQKTGTHFKVNRCTTESELKLQKQRARQIIEQRQLQSTRGLVGSRG